MEDLFEWMERKITLHYTIEFLYVVDGYEASYVQDTGRELARCHGTTLRGAIEALRHKVEM